MIHTCSIPPDKKTCISCNTLLLSTSNFCSSCGKLQSTDADDKTMQSVLLYALGYYFSVLALIFIITSFFDTSLFNNNVFSEDIIFIVITLIFAGVKYKELTPNLTGELTFKNIAIVVIGMVGFGFLISTLFGFIFPPHLTDNYYSGFVFTDYPIPFMLISIGLVPAIFEELAFRGFIYNSLNKIVSEKTTILITTFLFAILHISPISFLFIIPIGLLFAYLRMKSGHIWYGVIGHFVYNSTISLIDAYTY